MSRVAPRTTCGPPKSGKLTAAQKRAIDVWRADFRIEIGYCEACGHSPENPWRDKPRDCSDLSVQEIARGSGRRQKTLTFRGGVLCLCVYCNQYDFDSQERWPIPRQLALLYVRRPLDFAPETFVQIVRPTAPNYVTRAEVMAYVPEIQELVNRVDCNRPNWR